MPFNRTSRALLALALISVGLPGQALAQSAGSSGLAQFQNGYAGARQSVATAQTGSTRDANGNRLIVDGLIQAGASTYTRQSGGVSQTWSGAGSEGSTVAGSTAIGNNLNVVVQGSNNTVIVNSRQTNSGNISARTDLTGSLTGFE